MSDFAQAGLITTLQRLNETHAEKLEVQLETHAASHPITLVLPCHVRDLAQPALAHIVAEISGAKFLREIIVCVNGLDPMEGGTPATQSIGTGPRGRERLQKIRASQELRPPVSIPLRARELFARLPQPHRILGTDGPVLAPLVASLLPATPLPPSASRLPSLPGKGLNVWLACGIVFAEKKSQVIVTQDCDVVSFQRENLVRLCFAAVHPELRYALAKMYYSRATDRIYGRASRLFFAPLLAALARICGHTPLLDFLQSLRYPLAGETALSRELAGALPMQPGWGIEIGVLCESFRHADSRHIAQVDGGPNYDHRHQPLGDETGGLFRMAYEIAQTLFAQLSTEGLALDVPFFAALRESFDREAREARRRSRHLALINGLPPADDAEAIAALFARALESCAADFLAGASAPALPSWEQLARENPVLLERLIAASSLEGGAPATP